MSNGFSIAVIGVEEPFLRELVSLSARTDLDLTVASDAEELVGRKFDLAIVEVKGGDDFIPKVKQIPSDAIFGLAKDLSYQETISLLELGVVDYMTQPYSALTVYEALERELLQDENKQLMSYNSQHSYSTREISSAVFTSPLLEYLVSSDVISLDYKQKIELAWQEALANALEHGNLELESVWKNDLDIDGKDRFTKIKKARLNDPRYADKKLTVTVNYKNGELSFTIKDSGSGFTLAEKIPLYKTEEPYGRGIKLMNAVMDEVLYENGGTQLTLKKRI